MSGLAIRNVHKSYGSLPVLKGIDIEIAEGEFLILVGSSGCGKSTLLNMIAGLDTITDGTIEIGGRVVNGLPPKDRDIAMVFQSYALYPSMTVRENISFGLEVRKVPAAEQKRIVDSVAESLRITHLLDRKPRQLSGGQRQRVAMGRALARDPTLFLFDEPLSNLDAQLRIEMRTEIKMMHQRTGKTICYVTHDQVEAMTLGDRIAVMKDGIVQQLGSPQEVYDSPSNMYVASFIGAPPMNFIPGKLDISENATGLMLDTGVGIQRVPLPFSASSVSAAIGKEVVLGLRPEMITDDRGQRSAMRQLVDLKVDFIEPTGPDTLVYTTINGSRVLCRISSQVRAKPGQTMPIAFDLSKALLFDQESGLRLDTNNEARAAA